MHFTALSQTTTNILLAKIIAPFAETASLTGHHCGLLKTSQRRVARMVGERRRISPYGDTKRLSVPFDDAQGNRRWQ
jgi:hypothetical protein